MYHNKLLAILILTAFLLGIVLVFCPMGFLNAQLSGDQTEQPTGDQTSDTISGGLPNPVASDDFDTLIRGITKFLYAVGVPLGVIMILYSAFLFMTSGGNEERVKKAKKTIVWTLVGITIIIIGYGFVTLIRDILSDI